MSYNYANVSVIIPCYRCRETIGRAVASIAEQTLQPAEVILVDDCSGDNTLSELHRIQANYPQGWVKVIACSKNSGAGTARNVGWETATQPYVAFLDSDDSWHRQKIEIQYSWMMSHPSIVLTGHACQQVEDDSASTYGGKADFSSTDSDFYAVSKKLLLLSNRFPTRSVMLRRDIAQRFPDGKRYSEDYHLWLEICCAGLRCYCSDLPLAFLYKSAYGEKGLSSALWKMEMGELNLYLSLFNSRLINFGVLVTSVGWSLLKFLRRVLVVALKKARL